MDKTDHDILVELRSAVDTLDRRLDEKFDAMADTVKSLVTHFEFAPVRAIAYGMAGVLLMGVAGAVLRAVLVK